VLFDVQKDTDCFLQRPSTRFPFFKFYPYGEQCSPIKILSWDVALAERKMENQAVATATADVAQAVATD